MFDPNNPNFEYVADQERLVKVVNDYKKGKEAGLKFLVGQVMRLSGGTVNYSDVENLFKSSLI